MMSRKRVTLVTAAALLLFVGAAFVHKSSTQPNTLVPHLLSGSADAASSADNLTARVRQLEKTLGQTLEIQHQLLELVNELSDKLAPETGPGETRQVSIARRAPQENTRHPVQVPPQKSHFERMRENRMRQLTDAGFSTDRAAFIVDQQERIQYQQMQFVYEFQHHPDKSSAEAQELQKKIHTYSNPRRVFEQQLSDTEFQQYLSAVGGRTKLQIGGVLEAAPAYEAGLRPGDKIIRYNNQRVYHTGDLRSQVYRAKPGSTVAVEIQRKGSSAPETIYLPAGPLGIQN